jgi:ubiquinone/menaquinone biosynthesis C-methylase UbiE
MRTPFDVSVQRFNDFAVAYAERFMNIEPYRVHFDAFCSMMEGEHPAILELACGPGNVTRYMRQVLPGSDILAIDLAPRMIEIARETVPGVDFRVMDVRDIKVLDNRFDAIMCSFCLPFLSTGDTNRLIEDCAGLLKEGGVLYLSTMEGDAAEAGFEPTSFTGAAEIYFNYHRKQDLMKALTENGFTLTYDKQQDYLESDGSVLVDLILISRKMA